MRGVKLVVSILALMLMLSGIGGHSVGVSAQSPMLVSGFDDFVEPDGEYWDFYGIDISGMSSIDLYKMDLDISAGNRGNRTEAYARELTNKIKGGGADRFLGGHNLGSIYTVECGFFITFVDLTYTSNDGISRPFYLYVTAKASFKVEFNGIWLISVPRFNDDKAISISNGWYKWIIRQPAEKLKRVKVAVLKDDVYSRIEFQTDNWFDRKQTYEVSLSIAPRLYDVPTDPDNMNPDNPNFDPNADNTGSNTTEEPGQVTDEKKDNELLSRFWRLVDSVMAVFEQWWQYVVFGLIALLTSGLWIPLVCNVLGLLWGCLTGFFGALGNVFRRKNKNKRTWRDG